MPRLVYGCHISHIGVLLPRHGQAKREALRGIKEVGRGQWGYTAMGFHDARDGMGRGNNFFFFRQREGWVWNTPFAKKNASKFVNQSTSPSQLYSLTVMVVFCFVSHRWLCVYGVGIVLYVDVGGKTGVQDGAGY